MTIDFNKELENNELINSLIAFAKNYKNRMDYLDRTNKLSDYKRNGVSQNLKNADKIIILLNLKKMENGERERTFR